jgi:valyl-tRNA synthetase
VLLVLAPWPKRDGLDNAEAEAEIGWLIDLVTAIRSARVEMNIAANTPIPVVLAGASVETRARAGRWAELPTLARATLLAHRDQLPRLDDLTIDAADAVLGAGLATPAGTWLDDIPWFQWVRFHAKRLSRAEGV